jgi:hypothetical protein
VGSVFLLAVLFYVSVVMELHKDSPSRPIYRILLVYISTLAAFTEMGTAPFRAVIGWISAVLLPGTGSTLTLSPVSCIIAPSFLQMFYATLLLPVIAAALCVAIHLLYLTAIYGCPQCARGRRADFTVLRSRVVYFWRSRRPLATALLVGLVAFPTMCKSAFSIFQCSPVPLGGVHYLRSDLSVPCNDRAYAVAATVGWVMVAALCVVLPATIVFLVYVHRDDLRNRDVRFLSAWGFAVSGYSSSKWYLAGFEAAILLRRALLVLVPSVLLDSTAQMAGSQLVLLCALLLQVQVQPFTHSLYNNLEAASICVLMFTQLISQLSLTGPGTDAAGTATTAVLLILNVSWLALMGLIYLRVLRHEKLSSAAAKAAGPRPLWAVLLLCGCRVRTLRRLYGRLLGSWWCRPCGRHATASQPRGGSQCRSGLGTNGGTGVRAGVAGMADEADDLDLGDWLLLKLNASATQLASTSRSLTLRSLSGRSHLRLLGDGPATPGVSARSLMQGSGATIAMRTVPTDADAKTGPSSALRLGYQPRSAVRSVAPAGFALRRGVSDTESALRRGLSESAASHADPLHPYQYNPLHVASSGTAQMSASTGVSPTATAVDTTVIDSSGGSVIEPAGASAAPGRKRAARRGTGILPPGTAAVQQPPRRPGSRVIKAAVRRGDAATVRPPPSLLRRRPSIEPSSGHFSGDAHRLHESIVTNPLVAGRLPLANSGSSARDECTVVSPSIGREGPIAAQPAAASVSPVAAGSDLCIEALSDRPLHHSGRRRGSGASQAFAPQPIAAPDRAALSGQTIAHTTAAATPAATASPVATATSIPSQLVHTAEAPTSAHASTQLPASQIVERPAAASPSASLTTRRPCSPSLGPLDALRLPPVALPPLRAPACHASSAGMPAAACRGFDAAGGSAPRARAKSGALPEL